MVHTIQGKEVGDIGFGLMGLTWRPKPMPQEEAIEVMKTALNVGCNAWNAGEFYGPPHNNSMTLLRAYFAKYPEDAPKVLINVKGCANVTTLQPDGTPGGVRSSVENCLTMLGSGAGQIDQFESARKDPKVPIEDTVRALDALVKEGRIGGISLSEVGAETIRRAAKVADIEAVEVELSLWQTEPLTNGVCEACAELGIPIWAYSPIGRGIFGGKIKSFDDLPEGDHRRTVPRFGPDVFHLNLKLVDEVEALARKKGCTPAQIAINWVLALSKRPGMPTIIPIPGASSVERVKENSVRVHLTDEDMAEIDSILAKIPVVGNRYSDEGMALLE